MEGTIMEKLKPCPFCGRAKGYLTRLAIYSAPQIIDTITVACGSCGATCGTFSNNEDAIEAWDKRAAK
jgi:Lar family restriction alleviation protein